MGTHFPTQTAYIDYRGDIGIRDYTHYGKYSNPWYNKPEFDSPHDEYKKPSRKQKKKLLNNK